MTPRTPELSPQTQASLPNFAFGVVLLLGMLGCASAPREPFAHDRDYLRVGVDPNAEANAVIESQKERNYQLSQRLVGRHFTALGFTDRGGRSRAVRIVTRRGIGIALDSAPQSPIQPATSYALIEPPVKDSYDVDRDGFEEVIVGEQTQGDLCLHVFRVRDVGFVDPVVVESHVLGQEICASAAIDLDGDGIIELSTELDLVGFPSAGGAVPHLRVPLWADEHRFVARPGSGPQRAWLAQERANRTAELERARTRLDVSSAYVLGIELAALAYLEQSDPVTQLAAFDRALRGMVLTPPLAAASLSARARIYTEWNDASRISAPRAIARAANKDLRDPAAHELNASKTDSAADPRTQQPVSAPRAQPVATSAYFDEPVLAEGEFVITPQSAAAEEARRRGARALKVAGPQASRPIPQTPAAAAHAPTPAAAVHPLAQTPIAASLPQTPTAASHPLAQTPAAATHPQPAAAHPQTPAPASLPQPAASHPQLPAADDANADRTALRELGNAAVAERKLATTARESAAAERREAQAARTRALEATDPTLAAEQRAAVAEHTAAAQRYVAEAAAHAAAAATHRAALAEQKARMEPVGGEPAAVVSSP